jgi:PPOX class probable F420-dependent enzyme
MDGAGTNRFLSAFYEVAGDPDPVTVMQSFMTRQSLLRAWGKFQQAHPLIVAPIYTDVPFEAGTDLERPRLAKGQSAAQGYYALRHLVRSSELPQTRPTQGEKSMRTRIPDAYLDLVSGPPVAALTTVMPDGQPQTTVVWCDFDGTHVLVNTMRGFSKEKNMHRNPSVTLLCFDPHQPLRSLEIRGTVVEMTEEGALEHLDRLCERYAGVCVGPPSGPPPHQC